MGIVATGGGGREGAVSGGAEPAIDVVAHGDAPRADGNSVSLRGRVKDRRVSAVRLDHQQAARARVGQVASPQLIDCGARLRESAAHQFTGAAAVEPHLAQGRRRCLAEELKNNDRGVAWLL